MKLLFIKLKNNIIEKIKNLDLEIKIIITACLALSLSVLVSFWVSAFSIVTCIIGCLSICLIKGIKKIYVLVYLLPFYNVIRLAPGGFVLSSVMLLVAILLLGLEFLIDLLKKNKKLDVVVTVLFAIIAIYILIPIGEFNLMYTLKFLSTLAILYLVYVNRSELDFSKLVFVWLIALLTACCFEPLRRFSVRLESFLPDFPAYVKNCRRFSGLTTDPNYFAVEVVLLLACLTQLYFSKKIRWIFYPLVFVLSIIGFITVSKAFLLTYIFYGLLTFIAFLLERIKNRQNIVRQLLLTLGCVLLAVLICLPLIMAIFGRFESGFVDFNTSDKNGSNGSAILNKFTTGRSEIWGVYLREIFSQPISCLFGHGIGSALPIIGKAEVSAHNFYLETLYLLGIFGALLISALVVYIFVRTSKKLNRRFVNFIPVLVILFMLLSLNSLISYRPYLLVITLAYSLNLNKKNNNQTKENGNG